MKKAINFSANNSDIFFSEKSSLEPNINFVEFEKDLNLEATLNNENNSNNINTNKYPGERRICESEKINKTPHVNSLIRQSDFAKSNEINFKNQIKIMEEEEENSRRINENFIVLSKEDSILFEEVVSFKKSDLQNINNHRNMPYKNKFFQSTLIIRKDKILEKLKT